MWIGVLEITAWLATSQGLCLQICPFLPKFGPQTNHEATKSLEPSGVLTSPSMSPPRPVTLLRVNCTHRHPGYTLGRGCHTPRQIDRQLIQLLSMGLSSLYQVHLAAGRREGLHLLQ